MDDARRQRWAWVGIALAVVLAAAIRARVFGAPWNPDELTAVRPLELWRHLADKENGINPPLLRILFNTLVPDALVVPAWRVAGFVCATAAVGLVGRLAMVGATRWWVGPLAALVAACEPMLVRMSVIARAYPVASGVYAAHLLAASALLRDRKGAVAFALTAVLLPQLHYLTVPLLGVEAVVLLALGLPWRRLPALLGPAALATAPLAWFVLTERDLRREAAPVGETLSRVLDVGALDAWPATAALLAAVLLCWPVLSRDGRLLAAMAVAMVPVTLVTAMLQDVRNMTSVFLVVPLIPVLARLVGRLPGRLAPLAVTVGALLPFVPRTWPILVSPRDLGNPRPEALEEVVAALRRGDHGLAERTVYLDPPGYTPHLWLLLTGEHLLRTPKAERPCGASQRCFDWQGVAVRELTDDVDGLVFAVQMPLGQGLPARCRELEVTPSYAVYDCAP